MSVLACCAPKSTSILKRFCRGERDGSLVSPGIKRLFYLARSPLKSLIVPGGAAF